MGGDDEVEVADDLTKDVLVEGIIKAVSRSRGPGRGLVNKLPD